MSANNLGNLGHKVSTRELNWLDMCMRAWGAEFNAPDHAAYEWSNGRRFDSTDRGLTGIYGIESGTYLDKDYSNYPDMTVGHLLTEDGNAIMLDLPTGVAELAAPPYSPPYVPPATGMNALAGYAIAGVAIAGRL